MNAISHPNFAAVLYSDEKDNLERKRFDLIAAHADYLPCIEAGQAQLSLGDKMQSYLFSEIEIEILAQERLTQLDTGNNKRLSEDAEVALEDAANAIVKQRDAMIAMLVGKRSWIVKQYNSDKAEAQKIVDAWNALLRADAMQSTYCEAYRAVQKRWFEIPGIDELSNLLDDAEDKTVEAAMRVPKEDMDLLDLTLLLEARVEEDLAGDYSNPGYPITALSWRLAKRVLEIVGVSGCLISESEIVQHDVDLFMKAFITSAEKDNPSLHSSFKRIYSMLQGSLDGETLHNQKVPEFNSVEVLIDRYKLMESTIQAVISDDVRGAIICTGIHGKMEQEIATSQIRSMQDVQTVLKFTEGLCSPRNGGASAEYVHSAMQSVQAFLTEHCQCP